MSYNSQRMPDDAYEAPDLFKAAASDDIAQMRAAISQGRKLSEQRAIDLMTPVHVAAHHGSQNFIRIAMEVAPQVAWMLDIKDMRPLEHAQRRSDQQSTAYLTNAMFPEMPPAPIPHKQ